MRNLGMLLIALCVSAAPTMHLLFNYIDDHGTEVPLNVLVDKSNKVIYLTTASGQNSTDGDTLEDYNTGYRATLIRSEKKCNIRLLPRGLNHQIAFYTANHKKTIGFTLGTRVSPVPEENLPKLGDRIRTFCNGTEIYDCISPRRMRHMTV